MLNLRVVLLAVVGLMCVFGVQADEITRPNIVYILADDMGYGDAGCYNAASKIPTPHIDRLAAEGVRFTDAHTPSSVCSPTRYGVLTGRYAWRTWLKDHVLDGFGPPLIDADRMTVGSLLQSKGYATACFGKWHLGMDWPTQTDEPMGRRPVGPPRLGREVDFAKPIAGGPLTRGFDTYYGISASLDMSPHAFIDNDRTVGLPTVHAPALREPHMTMSEGLAVPGFKPEHVMPAVTKKTVEYIRGARKDKPFFIYMPLSAPHLPVAPNKEFVGKSQAGLYGDFVVEVDATVGAVLAALEETGRTNDTLVIFTSDNGGLYHYWDFVETDDVERGQLKLRSKLIKEFGHQGNAHLRGTKADIWEGGHRVPFIARWPERAPAGKVCDELIVLTDLIATVAEIVDYDLPDDAGEDSYSFLNVLLESNGGKGVRPAAVHHSLHGMFAIRQGDWKLVIGRGSGGFSTPREIEVKKGEAAGQLYQLSSDPSETRNVYLEYPEVVQRLSRLIEDYQASGRSR